MEMCGLGRRTGVTVLAILAFVVVGCAPDPERLRAERTIDAEYDPQTLRADHLAGVGTTRTDHPATVFGGHGVITSMCLRAVSGGTTRRSSVKRTASFVAAIASR